MEVSGSVSKSMDPKTDPDRLEPDVSGSVDLKLTLNFEKCWGIPMMVWTLLLGILTKPGKSNIDKSLHKVGLPNVTIGVSNQTREVQR